MGKLIFVFCCFVILRLNAFSQPYQLVIKGGHVIDAKNGVDEVMDIAVQDGKIARLGKNIDTAGALQVVQAKGLYVTPGLIDIHTHNFVGTNADQAYMNGPSGVIPDGFTFRTGVTTVVDAGSSGRRTFNDFKKNIIDKSQTRVLAFLNIVSEGMRGGTYEQNLGDMDARAAADTALAHRDLIVGIKLAHFSGHDWTATDRAVEAGKLANIPVMIDFGGSTPPLSIEELFLRRLRPKDIFTHCFAQLNTRESIVDTISKKVKPFVLEAQKKGVVFDVGFGGISFSFSQAVPALKNGFYPNSISTDQHTGSMNGAMKDILNVMSMFLAMNMKLQDVIKASTWNPANEINRPELGHLSVGGIADIAILNLRKGEVGFFDYTGYKLKGKERLSCEMTIKSGRIVYDLNGIANPAVAPRRR